MAPEPPDQRPIFRKKPTGHLGNYVRIAPVIVPQIQNYGRGGGLLGNDPSEPFVVADVEAVERDQECITG